MIDKLLVVWQARFDSYGNILSENKTGFEMNVRFPGQYHDRESGLYYNLHRYYDSYSGRYISSDPIGLQGGLNTYGYMNANPVNYVDPLGLTYLTEKAAINAAIDMGKGILSYEGGMGPLASVVYLDPKSWVDRVFR